MIQEQIEPGKRFGYSQLYLDFLSGGGSARKFYSEHDYSHVVVDIDQHRFERADIQNILREQNTLYGVSRVSLDAIEELSDPRALCIFAGQQAGWFGGPMLSLVKALTAVKAARSLSEQLNRPVVPIFWIAGDDHDFDEANHTFYLNRQSGIQRIEYSARPDEQVSMGYVRLNDNTALEQPFDELRETLGTTDFTEELFRLFRQCYTTEDTFVTAFGKLMAHLTAEYGLVLFSPSDSAVKQLARPFFKLIIEKQEQLQSVFVSRNQQLRDAGYHLQVQKHEDSAHLFVERNGRTPVHRRGDTFTIGAKEFSKLELLALLESEPWRFSPDAITRPLMQSWLFPTIAQIGGPSEIAYFAQGNALFDLIDRPIPKQMARPTLVLVENRHVKLMEEHSITFEEIAGDIEQLVNRILLASFPEDIEGRYHDLRTDIRHQFDSFAEQSLQFDPSLREYASQTFGKIDFALKSFEGKLFASHKKKLTDMREKLYRLQLALYPNSAFQDRSLNIGNFIARYGVGVVSLIYSALDPLSPKPRLVPITEEKSQ